MALRLAWSTCPSARFRPMGRGRGRVARGTLRARPALALACSAPAAAPKNTSTTRGRSRRPGSASRSREDAITVQPPRIAIGPEPTQQIPQNQHAGQPPVRSDAPLNVVFVTANLTDIDSQPGGARPRQGPQLAAALANGNGTLQAILPTGVYRISAADIPGAKPAKLRRRPVPHVVRERRPAALAQRTASADDCTMASRSRIEPPASPASGRDAARSWQLRRGSVAHGVWRSVTIGR